MPFDGAEECCVISGLRWKPPAAALLGSVGLIWAVSLFGLFVDSGVVSALALVPRRLDGLPGVLGTLFVHGSLGHLSANTPPLLVLGGMVAVRGAAYYLTAALAIAVAGGLGLWVVGREAAHIGASGLVFGLFGFLVARGYYERRWSSIAAALVVIVLYGGMIAGVVPRGGQVSWEAHLCGLVAGILCAWSQRRGSGDAGVSR